MSLSNSYAVGAARGNSSVGGLIGYIADGSLSNSYATGDVWQIVVIMPAALVGQMDDRSSISNSYAT